MPELNDKKGGSDKVSTSQIRWLRRGEKEPGGKLPLFDGHGRKISDQTVRSCIRNGWAEPWFHNPLKPDWSICKLTKSGRALLENHKK